MNFLGVVRMMQAVLPQMRKQGHGQIIIISSASGIRTAPGLGFYGASKGALALLCDSEAPMLKQYGIGNECVHFMC